MVPEVPAREVEVGPLTATGTLVKMTFSRARLPPEFGEEVLFRADAIPIGVLLNVLSMTTTEPTSCALDPPFDMSIPTLQLLIESPMYVQLQSQSW